MSDGQDDVGARFRQELEAVQTVLLGVIDRQRQRVGKHLVLVALIEVLAFIAEKDAPSPGGRAAILDRLDALRLKIAGNGSAVH